MTKKFIITASEMLFYVEAIEAETELEAKKIFLHLHKAGTLIASNSADGLSIDSIEEAKK